MGDIIMKRISFILAMILLIFLVGIAFLAPCLTLHDPYVQNLDNRFAGPSGTYWFGTDDLGRCIYSRLILGTRVSLFIGIVVVSLNSLIGTLVGLVSGFGPKVIDSVVMGFIDILLAFPGAILTLAMAGILGPGFLNMIIALTVLGWVGYARLVRGMVLSLKEREFIDSARSLGLGSFHILFKHVLPNCLGTILVLSSMEMAGIILMAAGLSFLGLGMQGSFPEWGAMLNQGKDYLRIAPHIATFPGLAIMVTVLAFNLLGDGLRDLLQGEEATRSI